MADGIQITLSVKDDGTATIQKVAGQFGQMEKSGKEAAAKLSAAWEDTKRALALVGVAAGGVVAGLLALTKSVANTGDELKKLSQKTGESVEWLSALKHASESNNVPFESMISSLRILQLRMAEAKGGSQEAKEAFASLGVSVTDYFGNKLVPLNQVFGNVIDKLKTMTDQGDRARLMNTLFGRSFQEIIPAISGGTEGLKAYAAEAHKLGVLWTTEMAQAAEKFNDDLGRLKSAAEGLKLIVGTELLKVFGPMIEHTLRWAQANRELVATKVREYAQDLAEAIARIATGLQALRLVQGTLQAMAAGLGVILTGLSAFGLALAILAQKAVDLFVAFTPFGVLLNITFPEGVAKTQKAMQGFVQDMVVLTATLAKSTQELAVASGDNLAKGIDALTKAVDPGRQAIDELRESLKQTTQAQDALGAATARTTGEIQKQTGAANDAGAAVIGGGADAAIGGVPANMQSFIPQGDLPIASGRDPFFFGNEKPQEALEAIDREMAVLQNRLKMENWVGTFGAHRFQMEGNKALTQLMAARDQALNRMSSGMGNQTAIFNFNGTVIGGESAAQQFVRDNVVPELRQVGFGRG